MKPSDVPISTVKRHISRAVHWGALSWRKYCLALVVGMVASMVGNAIASVSTDSVLIRMVLGTAFMFVGVSGMCWWFRRTGNGAGSEGLK